MSKFLFSFSLFPIGHILPLFPWEDGVQKIIDSD